MLINIIIAIFIYFTIGFILFSIIETDMKSQNTYFYIVSFLVSMIWCLTYYSIWISMGLDAHRGAVGLFSRDSALYYLDAAFIAKSNFSRYALKHVITDHYHSVVMASQLFIFGEHVLIPKLYQVLLFSLSVVLWINIAKHILISNFLIKSYFLLILFCIPLLTYTAHALKEISLLFSTTLTIYGYTKYYYVPRNNLKYLVIALIGLFLMFSFRREFALIMLLSIILASFIVLKLPFIKKALLLSISLITFLVASSAPVFQQIGAIRPLTDEGIVHIGRTETGERIVGTREGGMLGSARYLISNPLIVAPMFTYGVLMVFFHPPFIYTPEEMINRAKHLGKGYGGLDYLTMGYYNLFFAFLLPFFFFGAFYLNKYGKTNPVLIAILFYFILSSISIIFGSDSYRRFKSSYFWPISYLYICCGIATYHRWKKYLPLVALVFIGLIAAYVGVDIIGWVKL